MAREGDSCDVEINTDCSAYAPPLGSVGVAWYDIVVAACSDPRVALATSSPTRQQDPFRAHGWRCHCVGDSRPNEVVRRGGGMRRCGVGRCEAT